jgi:Holliday junction DNA helicase RuvB
LQMGDWEFLFIDEIHKLGDHGPSAAENLYHMLEEKVLYLDDGVHKLADFTVIGATTDADKLPEPLVDRFAIRPYFQKYSLAEMVKIAKNFCDFYNIMLPADVMVAIAKACRGTPRVARELVVGARALQNSGTTLTPAALLKFKELEPDGLTRQHKAYILAMFQFFGRDRDGEWEYIAGEASLMTILRENKQGIARLERFLIECGLVDRTPRGRRLTPLGIARAAGYVRRGQELNSE